MLLRLFPHVRARDDSDAWQTMHDSLAGFDSMMAHVADPRRTPELLALREEIRSWRFYDHLRTEFVPSAAADRDGSATVGSLALQVGFSAMPSVNTTAFDGGSTPYPFPR